MFPNVSFLSEDDWRDLLREIHNRQVIPFIGPELVSVPDPHGNVTGPQALEAVVRPGHMDGLSLVSNRVGEQIVRFVAQRPDDTPLDQIEAVPPLVSLVCERLNAARLAAEPPQKEISDELVKSQGADILQRFYDESFAAFRDGEREAVREYVEERMVTVGGHRNPVAREDAVAELARRGISAPDGVLDALIARRLLTPELRGGIQRLEITHDVLAPLVVRGRKEREESRLTREAERRTEEAKRKQAEAEALAATERRHRRWLGVALACVSVLLLFAVGGSVVCDSGKEGGRQCRCACRGPIRRRTPAEDACRQCGSGRKNRREEVSGDVG